MLTSSSPQADPRLHLTLRTCLQVLRFHHIEWWCLDATSTAKRSVHTRSCFSPQIFKTNMYTETITCARFGNGLGMHVVGKSDLSTGNSTFASYVLRSHDMVRCTFNPGMQQPTLVCAVLNTPPCAGVHLHCALLPNPA